MQVNNRDSGLDCKGGPDEKISRPVADSHSHVSQPDCLCNRHMKESKVDKAYRPKLLTNKLDRRADESH
jgi:hypothetical protein